MREQFEQKTDYIPLAIFNISLVGIVFGLGFLIYSVDSRTHASIEQVETPAKAVFTEPTVIAQNYVVYDISTGDIIAEKNASIKKPLASITKVMSALTAREMLPSDTQISIRREFLVEEGDSGLRDGEVFSLGDLLDLSLVISSNDGSRAIASVAGAFMQGNKDYTLGRAQFIKQMNVIAQELGLSTLSFTNETGLDNGDGTTGGYGSAEDVAKLFGHIIKKYPDLLEKTHRETEEIYSDSYIHTLSNTNTALGNIPNVIASKTGFTNMAGGNLAVVFDAGFGRPIAVVVLGSTTEGRFTDVIALASSTLHYLAQ